MSCLKARLTSLPPKEGLRLLFGLENAIYGQQGLKAIDYGNGYHTKHRHTKYHDFFVAHLTDGEKVIDVGCGKGGLAADIADQRNCEVTGIDLNADSIALARSRYSSPKLKFSVGDVLKELPEGEVFDTAIMSNVLEHLPDRPEFLKRLVKVTNCSRVLIRVPLFERDWRVPLKREVGVEWRLDPTHETEYTPEQFREEIALAGLRITHEEYRWGEVWAVTEVV